MFRSLVRIASAAVGLAFIRHVVAQNDTLEQALPFDAREATIASTHQALYTGETTCRTIVSAFLSRIEALNNRTNAIIALDPTALSVASDMDSLLANGNPRTGPLFCIPILLKDNYDTASMPTTGGSLALEYSQPTTDAVTVKALKDAGAIVLGKANLHELALEGLSVSSLGGQTINPYDSTRTAGGSSGGTGAAIAASFAVLGTGTDTVNSLRSPASANGLFSCRPTRGLISRAGVIPVSHTQDAVGPIARCIEDVATALTIMASVGLDLNDNATALVPEGIRDSDYRDELTTGSLAGLRLGLLEGFFNRTASDETTPVNDVMAAMQAKLESAGASVIPITDNRYNASAILAKYDVQRYEWRQEMDAYLQDTALGGQHPQTLKELFDSGDFLVIPSQYWHVNTALVSSTDNATWQTRPAYATVQDSIRDLTLALQETFRSNQLDAIVYPQQQNLVVKLGSASQHGRNGILGGVTGSPVVAVPAGFSEATAEAPVGVPIGMEILGQSWTEAKLLRIAYQIQELTEARRSPSWATRVVPIKQYDAIPTVAPDRQKIPSAYPIGIL